MSALMVRVDGIDVLSLKVRYLIKAAQQGSRESVAEAADLFVQEAKAVVPVKTGTLRGMIHAEDFHDSPEMYALQVTPVVPVEGQMSMGSQFGAKKSSSDTGFFPPYARRIEYGFIGTDSLGRHYHQAAQPYMRPAFDTKKDEAAKAIKEGLYGALDTAMAAVAARRR